MLNLKKYSGILMTENEVKSFFIKYNLKIIEIDKISIWPCTIGKNEIKLGLINKKRTIYNEVFHISLVDRFDTLRMFDDYNKCCNFYENETEKHFKELREFRKLKQIQEDFE